MINENDDNSWLWKPAEIDFYYNWIPSEEESKKKMIYEILLFDYLNPKTKLVNCNKYIAWRSRMIKGFEGFNTKNVYDISFPIISFKSAISIINFEGHINESNINLNFKYDCLIKFRRLSKKRLVILSKELIETPGGKK